jgi:hypothetical protein
MRFFERLLGIAKFFLSLSGDLFLQPFCLLRFAVG